MRTIVVGICLALARAGAGEVVDLNAVHRIRAEAFENSRVMEHASYLTDVYGPRLTNSPGFRAAADWAMKRLQEYGLSNVKLEKWGPFGRGWSYSRFQAHIVEPVYQPIIGYPMAWAPGTNGVLNAEPVFAPLVKDEDYAKHKGKLKGKIVLVDAPRVPALHLKPEAERLSDVDLAQRFLAVIPTGPKPPTPDPTAERDARARRRNEFLKQEGAVAMVSTGYNGDGGTVFTRAAGSYNEAFPDPPPAIAITPEHYNRIVRLLEKKLPVRLEIEIAAQFHAETKDSFNIVAELPGGKKKDEIVMIGAHFDSWHGGTGATDNAAGSAVMMEVMRVLKALDVTLDRTVRLALWSGEEQGMRGSKAYIKEHFADPETMKLNERHALLAAYFNYDNGSGKIRGVHLQGNDMVRPIFNAWIEPLKDLGVSTLTIRDTAGTDHLSFDAVGLPGFQFVQDPLEYPTRTHHSNMDVYDHLVEQDLRQATAVVASFAYHAAMRPEMLPRKPLPKPKPKTGP